MIRCATTSSVLALAAFAGFLLVFGDASRADTLSSESIDAIVADDSRWQRDRKRDQRSRPDKILAFSKVEPGMTVLDLYTGGGYWAELFGRAVGADGRVVAQTNTAYRNFAGPLLDSRFENNRIPNVTVIDSEINDLALGVETFDRIFIGLGYHDIYFYADFSPIPGREHFFDQIREALKPDGFVIVVDHAGEAGSGNTVVQTLHRIEEEFAIADWTAAGFELVEKSDALRNPDDDRTRNVFEDDIRHRTDRFALRFRKTPEP